MILPSGFIPKYDTYFCVRLYAHYGLSHNGSSWFKFKIPANANQIVKIAQYAVDVEGDSVETVPTSLGYETN